MASKLKLAEIRAEKGLSRAKLGEMAHLHPDYIRFLESGRRKNPTVGVLQRLADALECPINDLISA